MNKNIYYIGMICLAITLMAVVFKIMHWPGAGIMLITGIGSLALIYLPVAYFKSVKNTDDKLLKFLYTASLISFAIDFVGMIFKIMHWPGVVFIMIVGIPLPFILFLPAYVIYHNKRKLKTDLNFFAVLMFMIYLGVFSALLAISPSYEILTSYARSSNALSEANKYLSLATNDNSESEILTSTKQLVKQIEGIKQKLIIAANDEDESLFKADGSVDYEKVSEKDIKLPLEQFNEAGLNKFNQEFEEYSKLIINKYPNKNANSLIQEMDDYRIPKQGVDDPLIVKLPLISALNILSDWQNKLLLISYMESMTGK